MVTLSNACKGLSPRRLEVAELTIGEPGVMFYVFGKAIKSFPLTIVMVWRTDVDHITHHNDVDFPNTGCLVMKDESGDMFEVVYSR